MPPVRKYDKDSIIKASLKLIESEGIVNFNARRLASYLGCSVQPIFHYFTNMEELAKEVYKSIYDFYSRLMIEASKEKEESYKKTGLAYIRFAREHKEFFKIIFMQKTELNVNNFMASGEEVDDIIKVGQKFTGLNSIEQKDFHKRVWIFTHGIACLVNTETVSLSDKEVESLLTNAVRSMLLGYKEGKKYEENN